LDFFKTFGSKKIFEIIIVFSLFFAIGADAKAGLNKKPNISKMVEKSDLIIKGKVTDADSKWKEDNRGKHIYTNITLDIIEKIKGSTKNNKISFEVIGGVVDDIREVVSDSPSFEIGENAIVFLSGSPLSIKQGYNSKIHIYDNKVLWNGLEIELDTFINDLMNLEHDPNIQNSLTEEKAQSNEILASQCYIYEGYKWFTSNPVIYKINENTSDCTGEAAAVQAAAATWNNTGANFLFHYGGTHSSTYSTGNSVNEILWGTTEDSVATTYFWVYPLTGEIAECDVVFDDSYNWSTTPNYTQMDIQSVALHEFGHWLELGDLYDDGDSGNVMYGYIDFGQIKRTLQTCDRQGICYIYGGCSTNYTLSVNSSGTAGVTITSSTGHSGTTNYTKTVLSGTSVSLTAPLTAGGKTFNGWTGSVTSSSQTITFSMTGAKTFTANYVTPTYTLTVNSAGASSVSISSSTGHQGTTNYSLNLSSGTNVTLTAPLTSGPKIFNGWTGDAATSDQSITFSMTGNKTVTANYVLPNYTLSVNSSGASSVPIASSTGHGGITNYSQIISSGTNVTLTAPAVSGTKMFSQWSGGIISSNLTISFSMDANTAVTADFISIDAPVLHEIDSVSGSCKMASWDTVPLAKDYYAECSSDPCFLYVDLSSGWITKPFYQFCGLAQCQQYWFRVKSGTSAWSQTNQEDFQDDILTSTNAKDSGDVILSPIATTETIGNTNLPLTDSTGWYNGLLALTDTNLAEFEIYLDIQSPVSIEFSIYEGGTSFYEPYNLIYSSNLADSGTGAKFYSSGSFSIQLKGGRYYMIGATWNGTVTVFYEENHMSPSFAAHTGFGDYAGYPSPESLSDVYESGITFYQRFSTSQGSGFGYFNTGDIISSQINLPQSGYWGTIDINSTTPLDTNLTIDVLPASGSAPILGYENVLNDADLSGITESIIRVRANLSTNDTNVTPILHDWTVTYYDPAGVESVWSNVESSSCEGFIGDFDEDLDVDIDDLLLFSGQWLLTNLTADFWPQDGDGFIDSHDFAVLANAWQSTPELPNWNITCDLDPDSIISTNDLAVFGSQWLRINLDSDFDIAPTPADGTINSLDFAVFAQNWLEGMQ
ncbi:MAG: hypothetical protein EHM20_01030, partial [Alphaproteobacteria bacterium]